MVMGVQDFQLILVNSYAGTTAAGLPTTAAVDLNTARGFASCSMNVNEEDSEPTRVLDLVMIIESRGLFNPNLTTAVIGNVSTPARGFGNYWEGGFPATISNISPVS